MKIVSENIQTRVPSKLKRDANIVLDDIGIDMTTAIRVYLRKIVTTRGIPFSLTADDSEKLEYVPVTSEIQAKMDKLGSALDKAVQKRKKQ